jgi:hypothetical protein
VRISTSPMTTAAIPWGIDDPVSWLRPSAASVITSPDTDTASSTKTARSVGSDVPLASSMTS